MAMELAWNAMVQLERRLESSRYRDAGRVGIYMIETDCAPMRRVAFRTDSDLAASFECRGLQNSSQLCS